MANAKTLRWRRVDFDEGADYFETLVVRPLWIDVGANYWQIGTTDNSVQRNGDPVWEGECRSREAAKAKALAVARRILEGALAGLGGPVRAAR